MLGAIMIHHLFKDVSRLHNIQFSALPVMTAPACSGLHSHGESLANTQYGTRQPILGCACGM